MTKAYAAMEAGGQLKPFEFDPKELGDQDAEVKLSHCGICHSDLHLIDNDWGISQYPLVAGHEAIGVVTKAGAKSRVKEGQRVGVGWQRDSCGNCEWCDMGRENLCEANIPTAVVGYGGFADSIRLNSLFTVPIPEGLSSENAAPLLCGGITVFSPLKDLDIRPWHKVGVIGIGGLGHMALQFARAFGCEVTAFSTSPAKEEEARKFGATRFVNSRDPQQLKSIRNSLDLILSTVFADLDWAAYLEILRPMGQLCVLGPVPKPLSIPAFPLIAGMKTVTGHNIGSPYMISEMLQFAEAKGIQAQTELMPISQINEAMTRLKANQARYRMVLKID